MNNDPVETLLRIAGDPTSDTVLTSDRRELFPAGPRFDELFRVLSRKNGFYAFESALHVRPLGREPDAHGLLEWNDPQLWAGEYKDLSKGCFFFAEDIFGGQFAIRNDEVATFDPETGEVEGIAQTLSEWCRLILDDHEVLTGFPLAHSWQGSYGPLPPGRRLMPRMPFVAGGEYSVDNLVLAKTAASLRLRASIADQIRDLPEGARVSIEFK